MIKLERKVDCCGCGACAGVCPKQCISILTDEEGFYYPSINEETCVSCGLCDSVCPVVNVKKEVKFKQNGYVVQHKDLAILKESTSGGAFTAFATYVIRQSGCVVGASMNSNLRVEHVIVDNEDDLKKFRNSKYVQSYVCPDIYKEVKGRLKGGQKVLFSGTACEVEAMRNYVGEKYIDNLFLIDVVCRAVPSPLAYMKYLEYQKEQNHAEISSLRFRDKHFGYKFPTVSIAFYNNKQYHRGIESDPWLRAFFSGICNRPSCYECVFKKRYRVSDVTIWDCFNYDARFPTFKMNSGATNVLIHTDKGRMLFEGIKEYLNYEKVDENIQTSGIKQMRESMPSHPGRIAFFRDCQKLSGKELYEKYFPIVLKNQVLYCGRWFAIKSGVYTMVKKIISKL